MNKLFWLIAFCIAVVASKAQVVPCATDETYAAAAVRNPEFKKIEDDANARIRQEVNSLLAKKGTVRYVPVVFHIIHSGNFENISQSQIMDQIRVLNEDYRKLTGTNGFSAHPLAADMELEFRLAQYDPNGNKHDGINRIYAPGNDSNANDAVKALSFWDSKKYLNVWVVSTINSTNIGVTGTVLGYAQFPWLLSIQGATDGIIMRADQVGMVGFADAAQGGRTLTHEIGHWLGLYHTFQGACTGGTAANCNAAGDQVCDTPPVASASFGCQVGKNSCTNDVPDSNDFIRDYMDYSDGTCMNMFTNGQKARVSTCMTYRTGIFGSNPTYIQNLAYAGLNNDGSYATVPPSPIKAPYTYGFDDGNPSAAKWVINNFQIVNNGFQVNNSIAYSGTSSIYMRNINNLLAKVNSRNGFQTPEIDLTTVANPTLEFYYAYAQRSIASNDSFTIRISNDFGMHEIPISKMSGAGMATGATQTSEYIPTQQEWKKVSVDLSAFKTYTHARFRFEFLNRRGNNIYVDEVTVRDGATGLEDLRQQIGFVAFPNPAADFTTLQFNLNSKTNLSFVLFDVLGQEVYSIPAKDYAAGESSVQLDCKSFKPGLYFLNVSNGNSAFSYKLLIN